MDSLASLRKQIVKLLAFFIPVAAIFLALALLSRAAPSYNTRVLYDGAQGGTPDTQGFIFQSIATGASQSYMDGATMLDSTAVANDLAGYVALDMPMLNRSAGYSVHFTLQVLEETHLNPNRAGFSVIVLSSDVEGIELGFWQDKIWAQEGGTDKLFTRAESAPFDTTDRLVDYELSIVDDTYTLAADGLPVLSGPLRNYTAFSGWIDPYETPNFFFLGDDTTSAGGKVRLAYAAVTTSDAPPPTPTATPPPDAEWPIYLPCIR